MTCGIYMITNKETGKRYIGQSIDIERRFKQHNRDSNQYIDRAINKYGKDSFDYKILYECSKEELDKEEQKFINLYGTYQQGYNLTIGGDFNPSKLPEIRKKMSNARRGQFCGKNHPLYGKHHSIETRRKISKSRKGKLNGENNPFYGKHHSEETKKRISEAKKGRGVGINNPRAKYTLWDINCVTYFKEQMSQNSNKKRQNLRKCFQFKYNCQYVPMGFFCEFITPQLLNKLVKEYSGGNQ